PQLGVLVLGHGPRDGVSLSTIAAGEAGSERPQEGDRDPTGTPSLQPDALVFDLRSTETVGEREGEGREFTNAYLVLLDKHGASSDQIIGLSIEAGDPPSEAVSAKELASRVRGILSRYRDQPLPLRGPRRLA